MARKVVYVDDVTGKEIADGEGGPVRFSLQDEFYELDISNETLAKLEKALKPYMDVATSVEAPQPEPAAPRRGRRPGGQPARTDKEQLAAMREWLRANGHQVSDRGRIAANLQELYNASH